jgi:hypothetical protein
MRAPGKLLMKLVRKQGHEKVPTEEFLKKWPKISSDAYNGKSIHQQRSAAAQEVSRSSFLVCLSSLSSPLQRCIGLRQNAEAPIVGSWTWIIKEQIKWDHSSPWTSDQELSREKERMGLNTWWRYCPYSWKRPK